MLVLHDATACNCINIMMSSVLQQGFNVDLPTLDPLSGMRYCSQMSLQYMTIE